MALVAIALLGIVKCDDNIRTIQLGEKYEQFQEQSRDEVAYYKLQINSDKYKAQQDLIVKVVPQNQESDPDIFISKIETRPKARNSSEWRCAAYGKDTCAIHHSNISSGAIFYIGILCPSSQCKFTLLTFLTDEFWLEDGVEFKAYLDKNDAKIFKFRVPSESTTEAKGNQSITIKASSYRSKIHDFSLTATINAGPDNTSLPNTNWNSKRGVPAWKQGQVIRIGKSDFKGKWCAGCEIDIILDVIDSGYYHIVAQTNEATPLLQNYVQQDDIVRYHETQCYKYYVKEEETNLQIAMTTYSGQIDVRINPLRIPDKWDDFRFQRNNTYDTIIDIRPWVRSHLAGASKGLYYICVQGLQTSTFTLKIREFNQDQRQTTLEDGYSESFFLGPNDMHVHLYHVPQLEYSYEDIVIEIDLVVRRGVRPILGGQLCMLANPEECRKQVTKELFASQIKQFNRAKDNGQLIKMVLNHNETVCADSLKGNCYYVIVIANPSQNRSMYQITAYHSQNNHILLQESQAYVDSVDDKRFKYYKYSLIDDDGIRNVSFELSPLHGDSDLYISRTNLFPNKTNNEKMSIRIGSGLDQIQFSKSDKNTTTLVGTYYVGVFGYQYASYSLLVHNIREGGHTEGHSMNHLVEGVSFSKTLENKFESFSSCFDVTFPEDDDRSILIEFQNTENSVFAFVKYGSMAFRDDSDFALREGTTKLNRGDSHYHRSGTYFLNFFPRFDLWNLFQNTRYGFRVQYRYENSLTSINSHDILNLNTNAHQYSYLQHFVVEVDTDIDIILSGSERQDIFVSFHANNMYPSKDQNDMTTQTQMKSTFSKGKSMYLPAQVLKFMNPACTDLGYAENEACILYISVLCDSDNDCQSRIKVEYENDRPKKIVPGSPRHSQVQLGSYSYYYLTIEKTKLSDLYAVLTPSSNENIDLFVNLQRNFKEIGQWDLPTANSYYSKSKQKLKTEMIQLTKKDLELCFLANSTDDDECIIIYGVYSQNMTSSPQRSLFNLVAYKDVLELKDDVPAIGYVREKEFSYFIYEARCKNCTLLFSLSSYTSGKPDIYIVRGDRLPSLNDYDIKKSTVQSDVISLNLETDFKKNSNATSMEGYYIIGVYGYQNTTFSISVVSQTQPVLSLQEGLSVKHQQSSFDANYFQFYNQHSKKDVEIAVSVLSGSVDLFVSTFTANNSKESYVERLPKSKQKSIWHVAGINSLNQVEGKEVVILQNDRNFCTDCYYLIGVVTGDSKARYSIVARSIEAEKNYTHLIKLGEIKTIKFLKEGETKIYQFMLDSKEKAQVIPTVLSGQVSLTVGFDETPEGAFVTQNNNNHITISDKNLKTETNYYIVITSHTSQSEITLTVQQPQTYYTLHDGIPQLIRYSDDQDANKYLIFDFPGGNSTVMFNIKSKTKDFFPTLFYRLYDGQEANDKIIFPPSETVSRYDTLNENDWDTDMYLLRHTQEISKAKEDASMAMTLRYFKRGGSKDQPSYADAIITMSYSKILKLVEGEEYLGELAHGTNNFALFKVDLPYARNLYIEFSQCLGLTTFSVIADPNRFDDKIQITKTEVMGKEIAIVKNIVGLHYILIESLDLGGQATARKEYLLKYKYISEGQEYNRDGTAKSKLQGSGSSYMSANGGAINYEYLPEKKGAIKLSWGKLYQVAQSGLAAGSSQPVNGVKYKLVTSNDSSARLDSVCAAKRNVDVFKVIDNSQEETEYVFNTLNAGEEIYFNVIAVKEDEQIAVPYQPVTLISMTSKTAYGGKWLILLLSVLFIIFGVLAFFFYCRGKKLEQRLEIELRDISAADGGDTQTYRRVKPIITSIGGGNEAGAGKGSSKYNQFADEVNNTDNP